MRCHVLPPPFDNLLSRTYNIYITSVRIKEVYMSALPQISEAEYEVMKIV